MKVKITFQSQQLTREELKLLLQSIRDCEQKSFPDKEISIWVDAPELSVSEMEEILASIKPSYKYKYGPFTLTRTAEAEPTWPEFREYAQSKYPELDEDLIVMIEDLIERRRRKG